MEVVEDVTENDFQMYIFNAFLTYIFYLFKKEQIVNCK
jgi:hypothetical protein